MGIEVIVCDSVGEVLATLQSSKANINGPVVAKSIVALRAIVSTKEMHGRGGTGMRCVIGSASINKGWEKLVLLWSIN